MSVIYRVIQLHSNPTIADSPMRFYPKAITLGNSVNLKFITERIKEISSLSRGDIRGVIQNLVDKLKEQLLEGKSVNIDGLGVFRLSFQSKGEETEKEVGVKSVHSVRICFRASQDLKIKKSATRAGEQLKLIRLEDYLKNSGIQIPDIEESEKEVDEEGSLDLGK